MFVIIALILIILTIVFGGALYLLRQALTPRTFPYLKSYALEVKKGRLLELEYLTWEKEELRLQSPWGYELAGTYFPLPGARKTVVIVHGFGYTRMGSVKYIPIFRDRGFNVLIYDQRYHGLSGGSNTTFGYYEKDDLKVMVNWALERVGAQGGVGIMGESLGAATCLLHAATDRRVAFVISDCAYADLYDQLVTRLRLDYHLPAFPLLPLAGWLCRRLAGFTFADVSPEREAALIQAPVLVIHGKKDTDILPDHARRLYAAIQLRRSKLYLVPNAGHAEAYWSNRVEYDRQVGDFLQQVEL